VNISGVYAVEEEKSTKKAVLNVKLVIIDDVNTVIK